jgi:hypothetical protein
VTRVAIAREARIQIRDIVDVFESDDIFFAFFYSLVRFVSNLSSRQKLPDGAGVGGRGSVHSVPPW